MKFQHCAKCGDEFQDLTNTGLLQPDLCPICFHKWRDTVVELSKAERNFIRDGINAGAPKPLITSHLWVCRKMDLTPNWMELEELAQQLDNDILEGKSSPYTDRRSGGKA